MGRGARAMDALRLPILVPRLCTRTPPAPHPFSTADEY